MSARVLGDGELSFPPFPPLGDELDALEEELFDPPHFDSASGRPLIAPATRYLDLSCVLPEHDAALVKIFQPRPSSPRVL